MLSTIVPMALPRPAADDGRSIREPTVNTAHSSLNRLTSAVSEARLWLAARWMSLPPAWRTERALIVVGGVVALSLLAAFHQVVHAGVERAAERDASAHRHRALAAICSVERQPEQRALCLLTTPSPRHADVRLAGAAPR